MQVNRDGGGKTRRPAGKTRSSREPLRARGKVEIHPVTADRWDDLAQLFGPKGACAGCWCMFWRVPGADWKNLNGRQNRDRLRRIVKSEEVPGVLAYVDGRPVGWCAVAPRAEYRRLANSRILKPIDDEPVWSIPCFFVAKEFRGRGLTVKLLRKAVEFAAARGAAIVEGYPVEPAGRYVDTFAYVGLASSFGQAGFTEAARRSPTRPIMRLTCRKKIGAR